jgi:shikimate dehydrogenase
VSRPIGPRTRLAAVVGWPVEHSRSPALHNAAYAAAGIDAVYVALAVRPGEVAAALAGARAMGFLGVNVTVPHKREALEACDRVDPVAARAGAVNTVVVGEAGLEGHNTDVDGFADALVEADPGGRSRGGRAVVLGSGGAARSVVLALARAGADVTVVARDPAAAGALLPLGARAAEPWIAAALAGACAGATLLVDATSAALDEAAERALPAPVPLEALAPGALVCSLVYHREPALLAAARARGLAVLDGGPMLVHQAARAFTLMTGAPAPVEAMRAALRKHERPA